MKSRISVELYHTEEWTLDEMEKLKVAVVNAVFSAFPKKEGLIADSFHGEYLETHGGMEPWAGETSQTY